MAPGRYLKGLVELHEDDEVAARREVSEELGLDVREKLIALGEVRQAGGKIVVAFAAECDFDPERLVSNEIEIEWPPRSGRKLLIPEVDEARWFDLDSANRYILLSQIPFLARLEELFRNRDRSHN